MLAFEKNETVVVYLYGVITLMTYCLLGLCYNATKCEHGIFTAVVCCQLGFICSDFCKLCHRVHMF